MFLDLFYLLRSRGVPVSPTEWLAFLRALEAGAAEERPREFYHLARALLVKRESHYDRFDLAMYEYLRGAQAPDELKLALLRTLVRAGLRGHFSEEELARIESMSLEELLALVDERLGGQQDDEDGDEGPAERPREGARGGKRDGSEGTRSAMALAEGRRFKNLRSDIVLDVRQMTVALRKLRRLLREGLADELDLDGTIDATARNGGDIDIVVRPERRNSIHLALFCDVGGSMEPFRRLVERLFTAAHKAGKFKRFRTYYFHNCIYGRLYKDIEQRESVRTDEVLRDVAKDERFILVGDACMAPNELFSPAGGIEYWAPEEPAGLATLEKVRAAVPRSVWLNPLPRHAWDHPTVAAVASTFPMFELTLEGLDQSIDALKKGLAWRRT
jgi:uncharacterized protein with von Willebrand factor type A (vWA) domain